LSGKTTVSAGDIASGLLVFNLSTGMSSQVSFTFQVQDDGGTANGGSDLDPTAKTLAFYLVPPPARPPSGGDHTVVTNEDTPYVFQTADFNFSSSVNDSFVGVTIASLPGAGLLVDGNAAVTTQQSISAADLAAGMLRYVPPPNANSN